MSTVEKENGKIRIDSGYFTKAALQAEALIKELPSVSLGSLASTFRKGIFDIRADSYTSTGDGVPFIRITDIKSGMIPQNSTAWISSAAHAAEAKTALRSGDLVLSKTAYPAAAMITMPECNVSQDTIAVRLSAAAKSAYRSGYIAAFLNSRLGAALMARRFQGNVQQHLSLEDGKAIRIPRFSLPLQDRIHALVLSADAEQSNIARSLKVAEDILLKGLSLSDWTPPNPLTYSASASAALAANRFDAQYFRPLFEEIGNRMEATGAAVALGQILSVNTRGRQPVYGELGLPVVNSKHVRTNRVVLTDNRFAIEAGSPVIIQNGDVLINGTGVGTLGRAASYLHSDPALPDNHVTVLRTEVMDSLYLSAFLNSPLGQWQVERHIKGSSGQIELYPHDIARIVVWNAPEGIQQSVREAVMLAFETERRANALLDEAKRAVEIALEQGEVAALAHLQHAGVVH